MLMATDRSTTVVSPKAQSAYHANPTLAQSQYRFSHPPARQPRTRVRTAGRNHSLRNLAHPWSTSLRTTRSLTALRQEDTVLDDKKNRTDRAAGTGAGGGRRMGG